MLLSKVWTHTESFEAARHCQTKWTVDTNSGSHPLQHLDADHGTSEIKVLMAFFIGADLAKQGKQAENQKAEQSYTSLKPWKSIKENLGIWTGKSEHLPVDMGPAPVSKSP